MSPDQIVVTVMGLASIGLTLWYFFASKKEQVRAVADSEGAQQVQITVKGGYTPDLIVVKRGRPVRMAFHREETAACSDTVVFGDFGISKPLPAHRTTVVELLPQAAGEYTFTCGMGMLRGKLIVEDA